MKRLIFYFLFAGSLSITSCKNDERNINEIGITSKVNEGSQAASRKSMILDEKVIEFFMNEKKIMEQAKNKDAVFNLANQLPSNNNQDLFYTSFNTTEVDFHQYIENQRTLMKYIEENYQLSSMENGVRAELLAPVIEQVNSDFAEVTSDCRGVYIAKLALNASVAYGAHVACLTADVTVVAGALCHSAVLVGQTAANYIALDEFKTCIKNKK